MNKKYTSPCFTICFLAVSFCMLSSFRVFNQEHEGGYTLRTVIIDAGHGGKDPGSLGKQSCEKEVVLAIALKAGKYIEENFPKVRVIYTRKTDEFVPLHQRAEIANSNKADLFISIHANGNENNMVTGTESLVLGLHRANENFEVAKKENSVILLEDDYNTKYEGFDPNTPESYMMFSLMQNLYFEQSINLAGLVQEQFRDRAQRKDRGVKQQGLLVLARTAMPGILIETGFITNPDEEKYLISEEGQDFLASAIFRAFRNYKNLIETKNSFAIASPVNNQPDATDTMEGKPLVKTDSVVVKPVRDITPVSRPPVEFKVQIAASSRILSKNSGVFKGQTGITEYRVGNIYKYAVGSCRTFQEALAYSRQVKERFPDAFIIAVKEDKIIPLDQALKEIQQSNSNN
jgi:N-acetylmuramoyl-L-alanine amidase